MTNDADYSNVLTCTKKIEETLEKTYGARGRGLGEKAISVRHLLGEQLVKKIMFLSTIRNKLFHEPEYKIDNVTRESFSSVCKECKIALNIRIDVGTKFGNNTSSIKLDKSKPGGVDWSKVKYQQKKVRQKLAVSVILIAILFLFYYHI